MATKPTIERERSHFKQLIALNPNHFGSFRPRGGARPGPGVKGAESFAEAAEAAAAGNTSYASLGCVGYNPTLALLEATVTIKRDFGYAGDLCSGGSTEFVRFYVDLGGGWVDAGVAAFQAHDIPGGRDCAGDATKPLTYAVSLPFDPARHVCWTPQLPLVRAVLSWQWMPPAGQPDWIPPWGERVERRIQIAARRRFRISELLKDAVLKVPLDLEPFALHEIDLPEPAPAAAPALAQLYAKLPAASAVPAPRFAGAAAQMLAGEIADRNVRQRFFNAAYLLLGVLRYRILKPRFLLGGADDPAHPALRSRIVGILEQAHHISKGWHRKMIEDVEEYFEGRGTNQLIFENIESLSDPND